MDPSCLLEMALGLGRVQAEVSLPLGGQGWTSLRRDRECVAVASTPIRGGDSRDEAISKQTSLYVHTAVVKTKPKII